MTSDICILVLVGLPASGKTSFTQFLVDHFNNESKITALSRTTVIPVSYDKFIPFYQMKRIGKFEWKEARKEVLKHVDKMICKLKRHLPPIQNIVSSSGPSKKNTLIVIDDNMYYRSMRFEYFQLAKRHGCGFCQFYFLTTVQNSLYYNSVRPKDEHVPESIIYSMSKKFEPPNSIRNSWEQFTLTLAAYEKFDEILTLQKICQTVITSIENPVKQHDVDNNCNPVGLQECSTDRDYNVNYLHEIDLTLRRIVGKRVKSSLYAKSVSSEQLAVSFQELSVKKKNILDGFKSGKTTLPANISDILKKNECCKTLLYEYLSQML